MRSADDLIAATARRQHGVITHTQLCGLGLTGPAIAYRLRVGRLHRMHRGVYAVGHPALSTTGRYLAAVVAIGPGAVLSHVAAAELWGVLQPGARRAVDVTVARHLAHRAGIRVHCVRAVNDDDRTRLEGIPITTPQRTLLDLAATGASEWTLRRAVGEAEVQRRASARSLIEAIERAGPRAGSARLGAIVRPGPAPTRSVLEDRTLAFLEAHGFPRPQVNVRLAVLGGEVEADFLYPEQRLVIETDGARFHDHSLARERDAKRQARIEAAGYRVLRLTWQQLTGDGLQTVTRLRAALRAR